MKTCRDCQRFLGLHRIESKDQYGRQLFWNEFQCDRSDIPPEERTHSEDACMGKGDGIFRLYQNVNDKGVFCASDCFRFKQKTNQTEMF